MSSAYPEFRVARCTRYRYRYSECRRCADACPHQAIGLTDEGAAVDQVRCRNCALCVSACRTGAWAADGFKPIDLLRQAIKQKAFSFSCAPSGVAADAIVPCLGALDGVTLAYLARRGIPVTLHGSQHCGQCEHGPRGAEQLALNLEAMELLRQGMDEQQRAGVELAVDAQSAGTAPRGAAFAGARRQLFRRFVGRGVDAATGAAAPSEAQPIPEKAIRAGAYAVTEQRELLHIVCRRDEDQAWPLPLHDGLPAMGLSLSAGCTACEACFRACPTGALHIRENPSDWALLFRADRCVACGVCLEVCQPRVLDAQAEFDARPERPERVLHSLCKQRCGRCDRFFVSSSPQPVCPVCHDDEDAFSAIFG
ncbi:MAG: 4Fe-4S dicluster domain-containing protein [Betaproteobacteria bacterium]|nr:4Fe-4S dicluster domain-containing protein [Betaproteobacteria bacterium]